MQDHVNFNIQIKKKFIVNGREYGSVKEMPEDARNAYEKASALSLGPDIHTGNSPTKVVFNGQEYRSAGEMPPEVRRIYEGAIAAVQSQGIEIDRKNPERGLYFYKKNGEGKFPGADIFPKRRGINPSSTNWKLWGMGLAIALILAFFYTLT